MSDFPELGTNYLGVLQIRADCQGQGLARAFHDQIAATFQEARRWRLTVVDTNSDVQGFWERMGYEQTGESRPWNSGSGVEHSVFVMERDAE